MENVTPAYGETCKHILPAGRDGQTEVCGVTGAVCINGTAYCAAHAGNYCKDWKIKLTARGVRLAGFGTTKQTD